METVQIRITKELLVKADELVKKGIYSSRSEIFRDSIRRLVYLNVLETKKEKEFKIVYTSDIHGNKLQYQKLFAKALKDKTDAIIIGGDITPKDPKNRTIKKQIKFLKEFLLPKIKEFHKKAQELNKTCKIFLMLGNDDFKSNERFLKNNENGFKLITNNHVKLYEQYNLIGYNYVPMTPYIYKDWEKLDANNIQEKTYRKGFITEGIKAKGKKLVPTIVNKKNTIENDLNKLFSKTKHEKVVFVSHAPPYNTHLDVTKTKEHVGSIAINKIIRTKQPLISLHGHIHETVDMTGFFQEQIGKTLSMSSGNYHTGKDLAVISFNLFKPKFAVREII